MRVGSKPPLKDSDCLWILIVLNIYRLKKTYVNQPRGGSQTARVGWSKIANSYQKNVMTSGFWGLGLGQLCSSITLVRMCLVKTQRYHPISGIYLLSLGVNSEIEIC